MKKLGEFFGAPIAKIRLRVEKNGKNNGCSLVGEIERLRTSFITKPSQAEIDTDFSSRKFEKATYRIKYDIEYDVFFIPILASSISVSDCVSWLKEEGYLLCGPTLLPLIRLRKEIPKEIWLTSLDVEKYCYERGGDRVYACMKVEEDGYFQLPLAIFSAPINKSFMLVGLKEVIHAV